MWRMDSIEQKQLLWCLLCDEKFTAGEATSGLYMAETGICTACYVKMKNNEQSCFGKEEYYDKTTLECSTFCKDRNICPHFAFPKGNRPGKGI